MELDPSNVPALVRAAREGDPQAWEALIDRFLPMVRGVIGRFRLPQHDAADVNQTVWLRLVEHLDELREPAALPGWLATTARRESIRAFQSHVRSVPVDPQAPTLAAGVDETEIDREVLQQERALALRAGLAELGAGGAARGRAAELRRRAGRWGAGRRVAGRGERGGGHREAPVLVRLPVAQWV